MLPRAKCDKSTAVKGYVKFNFKETCPKYSVCWINISIHIVLQSCHLHLHQITILQKIILITLQRGEVAHTVINRYTCWKGNTWNKIQSMSLDKVVSHGTGLCCNPSSFEVPFFISFSFLKILPVSSIIKASPFSQRLSMEASGVAASTSVRRTPKRKSHKVN